MSTRLDLKSLPRDLFPVLDSVGLNQGAPAAAAGAALRLRKLVNRARARRRTDAEETKEPATNKDPSSAGVPPSTSPDLLDVLQGDGEVPGQFCGPLDLLADVLDQAQGDEGAESDPAKKDPAVDGDGDWDGEKVKDTPPAVKSSKTSKGEAHDKQDGDKTKQGKKDKGQVEFTRYEGGIDVDAWITAACSALGIPCTEAWLKGYRTLCERESTNKPNEANKWDSNAHGTVAADGLPYNCSRGIAQCIPTTFSGNHASGTSWSIYDPVANIAASMNYVRSSRYNVKDDGSNLAANVQQADPTRPRKGY